MHFLKEQTFFVDQSKFYNIVLINHILVNHI